MVNFVVRGPIEVPMKKGAYGQPYIDEDQLRSLCDSNPELTKPGCYVFACASARGSLPIYVGQAGSGIFAEAFNPRNKNNVNGYFRDRFRGSLHLYIVPQVHVKGGRGSVSAISDVEEYLIAVASRRNVSLINVHGTRPENWSIAGVRNHGNGHPGTSVIEFKRMMGLSTTARPRNGRNDIEVPLPEEGLQSELPSDVVLENALQPENVESVHMNSAEAAEIDDASRPNIFIRIYHALLCWLRIRKPVSNGGQATADRMI
jgi:hypothetical protein